MKARFYLSSKVNSEGRAAILLFLSTHSKRVTVSTGKVIKPQNWNSNSQRAKGTSAEAITLNHELTNFGTKAINILTHLVESNHPNLVERFKKDVKKADTLKYRLVQSEISGLGGSFLEFIETYANTAHKSRATLIEYKTTLNILKDFQTSSYPTLLSFEAIDLDFYNAFIKYCEKREYSANSIGRHIKSIKFLMGEAEAQELHENAKYRNKRFRKPGEESFSIFLNEKEIETIYKTPLPNKAGHERVRDLFVAACWLGVRISDLFSIESSHISDDKISIRIKKTGEFIDLPIHPTVRKILTKYNGSLPPKYSEQKFNQMIKEVAKIAGLTEDVSYSQTKGGKLQKIKSPKYDLVSAHTARRSFATNMYLRGIPIQIIMAVTGHSTEKSFRTYIKSHRFDAVKNLNQIFNYGHD